MCLAIPAEVMSIEGAYALVDIMGVETKVYILLIEEPRIGDHVLVHAGCAIERIHKEYYSFLEEQYKSILDRDGQVDG
ncbi:MAG: hydrogenase assembly chaperone hypC/hupF [Anaerosolibacter sp.]|jgi:hydrogenase expression/formation protein HypC|uniref:HypC/HybG/HupF family hydrogenase formation chaperone n=1 Tax=Anaerosolibacter sp. TaxID=1872527 RepID=UPI002625A729|nr:HypC/HybG/HupF family hydrogenase formation chaperone [Anaerosolibacter sp.]MDF2547882.1 hydrogenase assembly chaperone hypC/hupF [Anaerosolibacter sp.]